MAFPDPIDRRGHELAMRLRAAYAHLRRSTSLALDRFEMSSDQYVLLTVLAEDGELTQQELARRCASDTATTGAMVALLETKRLVSRQTHPLDARARSVALTRRGRVLAMAMRRAGAAIRRRMVALFNDHEWATLLECLSRLADALSPAVRRRTSSAGDRPALLSNRRPRRSRS